MKRLAAFLTLVALLTFGIVNSMNAQQGTASDKTTTTVTSTTTTADAAAPKGFHQTIKNYFIQGGPGFMASILLCLVFGLAIAIERTLYLNLSTTNTKKLLNQMESVLESKGLEAAKTVCQDTRGPVASIFYQGLTRYDEGLDMVEKSVVSYGGVLMGRLESGLSWISLFIATAPMLGFLGTVIGMVQAFDAIEAAGDISPTVVAGGIKIALLTTVFGLIVAIILQLFYNYLVTKIDSLVNDMEDSSITFIDILSKYKK
jgi:biopolymer transport protein ExbB